MACVGIASMALNNSVTEPNWNAANFSDRDLEDQSYSMAHYYVSYYLRCKLAQSELKGLPKVYLVPAELPCEQAALLSRLCLEMEQANYQFFQSLPSNLNLNADNACAAFTEIAKQAFGDGKYNWGRVVSVFTLAGVFAVHFTKEGKLETTVKVASWLNCFVLENLLSWIKDQGGWVSSVFCKGTLCHCIV